MARAEPAAVSAANAAHLDAFRAQLDGSDIEAVLPRLDSITAKVKGAAPGLALEADAAMLQRSGGGKLSLQLASADETAMWVRGLPVIGERLPALRASGAASLQADWQGGWRQWAEGFARPARYPQDRPDGSLPKAESLLPTLLRPPRLATHPHPLRPTTGHDRRRNTLITQPGTRDEHPHARRPQTGSRHSCGALPLGLPTLCAREWLPRDAHRL